MKAKEIHCMACYHSCQYIQFPLIQTREDCCLKENISDTNYLGICKETLKSKSIFLHKMHITLNLCEMNIAFIKTFKVQRCVLLRNNGITFYFRLHMHTFHHCNLRKFDAFQAFNNFTENKIKIKGYLLYDAPEM